MIVMIAGQKVNQSHLELLLPVANSKGSKACKAFEDTGNRVIKPCSNDLISCYDMYNIGASSQ